MAKVVVKITRVTFLRCCRKTLKYVMYMYKLQFKTTNVTTPVPRIHVNKCEKNKSQISVTLGKYLQR